MVQIDLTSAANRKIDLQRTGWIVHQGQKIVLQDYELHGEHFVWDYDVSSCKDSYLKQDAGSQPQAQNNKAKVNTTKQGPK